MQTYCEQVKSADAFILVVFCMLFFLFPGEQSDVRGCYGVLFSVTSSVGGVATLLLQCRFVLGCVLGQVPVWPVAGERRPGGWSDGGGGMYGDGAFVQKTARTSPAMNGKGSHGTAC